MSKLPVLLAVVLLCFTGKTLAQKKAGAAVFKKQVVRIVEDSSKPGNAIHHLNDVTDDSSLYQLINAAVRSGRIKAYSDDFKNVRTIAEMDVTLNKLDVVEHVEDPVSGEMKTVERHTGEPTWGMRFFKVQEEWTLNPSTGKTNIQIIGVGPVLSVEKSRSGNLYRAFYWVKYADIKPILLRYATYHPNSTLQGLIWDNYFTGDVKPK